MDFEEAYKVADEAVLTNRAKRLTDAEVTVLRGAWCQQSYDEIASGSQYSLNYLKRDVGPKLWRVLSEALGEEVGKTNFRVALERKKKVKQHKQGSSLDRPSLQRGDIKPEKSRLLRKDWGESFDINVSFYGRTQELNTLEDWILQDRCRLVGIFGIGGLGKTSLAAKLADHIKDQFDYFIWRSLRHLPPAQDILEDLIDFLSNQQEVEVPEDTHAAICTLLEYLRKNRCLIVLDSAEMILKPQDSAGRYAAGFEEYGDLFTRIGREFHQSCVVLTSREKLKEFTAYEGDALPVRSLQLEGLDKDAAMSVLRDKGLAESAADCQELIQQYSGNPFAFKIAATAIKNLFNNSIACFLAAKTLAFDGIRLLLERQFERLSHSEVQIIYWLAIHRERVPLAALQKAIVSPMLQANLLEALYALGRRSLVEKDDVGFTLQPTVMEFVTLDLVEKIYQEIVSEKICLWNSHALMQAKAKDHIRINQTRTILRPLIDRLLIEFNSEDQIKNKLIQILVNWRNQYSVKPGYIGGNILNLLQAMQIDLAGADFSHLSLRQAYLPNTLLQSINFTASDLADCTFTETLGTVWSIAFSSDGQWLAAGDDNGQISIWDRRGGDRKFSVLTGHDSWIRSVAFSPDGAVLASGSQDLTVRLWNVETGQYQILQDPELKSYSHKDWVRCVQFSPGGELLASSSDDFTIKLWNVTSGERCKELWCEHRVRSIAFSVDGLMLASCSDDYTVTLWDLTTGEYLRKLEQHRGWVRSVIFSPDGHLLASCSDDGTIKLWDIATGKCIRTLEGHHAWVRSIAFNPDGTLLASGSDDYTVKLWQVATGQCCKTLDQHTSIVLSVAFSPDSLVLASGGDDQTVRQWEVETGRCLQNIQGYTNGVRSVAFSPDRTSLISGGSDNRVRLWNLEKGTFRVLTEHQRRIWSVAYSPNGKYVASSGDDHTVRLWHLNTGELPPLLGHENCVRSVVFSPNGRYLASSSNDRTIRIWDFQAGHCLQILSGNEHWVRTIAFSPDGKWLGSGNDSQIVSLWDITSGHRRILGKHEHRVRSVVFSPNNKLLASGSDDKQIKLWNVTTREELKTLTGHTSGVQSLVFFDDQTLISGSDDRTIKIWDLATGECLRTLTGHDRWVRSVALSADRKFLASGGNDRAIRIWDIQTGEIVKTLTIKSPYEGMNITHTKGLTLSQKTTLLDLGAIDQS